MLPEGEGESMPVTEPLVLCDALVEALRDPLSVPLKVAALQAVTDPETLAVGVGEEASVD